MAAGGVVFRRTGRAVEVLLIRDRFGRWTLPKGGIDVGEDAPAAALREIAEETGLIGSIRGELGECRYAYPAQDAAIIAKTVTYFLVEATGGEPRPGPGEVLAMDWCPLDKALVRQEYPNNRPILERAGAWLAAHPG